MARNRNRNTSVYLSLGQLRFDGRPCFRLSSIAQQVHDDASPGDSLVDLEQVLAGDPAILFGLFPRCAVLAYSNDHVQPVVSEVETLTVTLRAVADESESVILEVFLYMVSLGSADWINLILT